MELLMGLSLGLAVSVLFQGLQLAGQTIAQISGLQLGEIVSPGSDVAAPAFSHLLHIVALAIFVVVGGHRQVLGAVLDTFAWLPAGTGGVSASLSETMSSLMSQAFALSVRASAAGVTALLISTLILGLIGRTLPQLHVMTLGLGLNWLVALVALALSLGAAAWILQDQIRPMLERLLQVAGGPA
jgi:flagellar biosynthetic protein FliR